MSKLGDEENIRARYAQQVMMTDGNEEESEMLHDAKAFLAKRKGMQTPKRPRTTSFGLNVH